MQIVAKKYKNVGSLEKLTTTTLRFRYKTRDKLHFG